MEVYMALSKKTTILLTPELHKGLSALAEKRGSSIGALIRGACEKHYGLYSIEDRVLAVKELGELTLPAGSVRQMKRESIPDVRELLP